MVMRENYFKVLRQLLCNAIENFLFSCQIHSDLITYVGEPSKPPDPLDPTTVNLFDQSDFVAVTWSEYTTFSR